MVDILPRITVSNFQSIPANTPVRFHILYLNPPSGTNTHTVKLSIISLQNRICSNLNEIILSFTISALGAVGTTNSQSISYTSSKVNTNFDLTFMPFFGNVVINDYILVILPSYDTKFIQLNQIISCSVKAIAANDFTSLPCIPYYGVDWILIQTPIALTNTATLKITNLIWPRYVQTLSTNLCFKTAVFSNTNNQYRAIDGACSTPIISPNANNFNLAMISAPKKGLGYVDCTYTFTFNVDNKIPDNSKIVLTFPSSDSASYSLIESSPVPIFSAPLLVGYNGGSLQFSTTINQLTVSNVGEYPAGSTFTIVADGIKNPVSGIISSGWNIEIYYSGNLVNSQLDFFSFPFGPAFTSGYVIINQISAFPINADEYADFTIVFTPQTDIPNSGLISVTFPANQYKELPGNLDCVLSGGIQTFTSCILSSTTVKIVTGEKYTAGVGSIYLKIKNIKNPDAGTTDGFLVTTSYDGVTLDITDQTSLSGRTFTSFPKARNILKNITFFRFYLILMIFLLKNK